MKIKAYQVAPEYQETHLLLSDDIWEGLEIYGNDGYKCRTSTTFDNVLMALNNGTFEDVVVKSDDAARLENLAKKYYTPGTDNEAIITEALSIVTGEKWDYKRIHGSCQSDWNYIYYRSEEWTEKALEYFGIEYFNTGDEWRLEDEDGNDFGSIYTHEWRNHEKKTEIAENMGVDIEDVTLYLFDGWTRTAKYKEV